jgi:signal transduction histidine kinase
VPALTAHAGLPVRLRVSGDPARLPRGIDLAVTYRIVQEALTNAARHHRAGTTVYMCRGDRRADRGGG